MAAPTTLPEALSEIDELRVQVRDLARLLWNVGRFLILPWQNECVGDFEDAQAAALE
jgi:hypothetical protein